MGTITQTQSSESIVKARVEDLLAQMTLKEKVAMLSGTDLWHTAPIERLGIPSILMTDGPHGVRAAHDGSNRVVGPATTFPTGVSMASSWDPDLVEKVGKALAEETRAMGCHILLGPCVNIVRSPLGGRNFESYSEDPYLAGQIGKAFVKGVQSQNIGTSLKHFAANNQEKDRNRGSSEVDERTLREIYLPAFETVVKEARPWTVMCSYNRINGTYASENKYLLTHILKEEWAFEGAVVSDWGAVHTTVESVNAGLDIEMPGPSRYYGDLLTDAVNNWQVEEATIDAAVRRILRMVIISGEMEVENSNPPGSVNTPEHQALARQLAEESIVLLKNKNQLLPLKREQIKTMAVIGPNAAEARYGGGGSSYLEPPYAVSPLQGIKVKVGDQIEIAYEQGCTNQVIPPALKTETLTPPTGKGHGLLAEFYNNTDFSGTPGATRIDPTIDYLFWGHPPADGINRDEHSIRWTGTFTPDKSGPYTLILTNTEHARLYVDNKLLIDNDKGHVPLYQLQDNPFQIAAYGQLDAIAGNSYNMKVEYIRTPGELINVLKLLYVNPPEDENPIERAARMAKEADVAVIFAGMPTGYETEGNDRPDMELPGLQTELIKAVAAANPNTVVVLNAGSPVSMPWLDDVAAVLEAYYPGLEGGSAVTNVLFGDINPSGKLTETFPMRLEDNPAYMNFPGDRRVYYGERIYVGYRYYDLKKVEPLFPFGFGLSYTSFQYSDLRLPQTVEQGQPVEVSLVVRNSGLYAGKEVVQLYVRDAKASVDRPLKELKGFKKVTLEPGESKTVSFTLDERALSFYDIDRKQWVAEPGEFILLAGSSSQDIRLTGSFELK